MVLFSVSFSHLVKIVWTENNAENGTFLLLCLFNSCQIGISGCNYICIYLCIVDCYDLSLTKSKCKEIGHMFTRSNRSKKKKKNRDFFTLSRPNAFTWLLFSRGCWGRILHHKRIPRLFMRLKMLAKYCKVYNASLGEFS